MTSAELIAGGNGCDLVTGTGEFSARIGKIGLIISNADATRIESLKRTNAEGTEESWAGSYVGAVDINDGKTIKPDFPMDKIKLSAGSIWVIYVE